MLKEIELSREQEPNDEAVTRQALNQMLRHKELWSELELFEAELFGRALGDWPISELARATEWAEQLRLLRWVFHLDDDLQPLRASTELDGLRGGAHRQLP